MSIYDNAQIRGFNPGRGEQRPERYPFTGPNYAHFGEPPPGWVYSPRDDKYYRDSASQQALREWEEQQGLREKQPKQPGLLSAIAPTAGTLSAMYLAKTLGEEAVPFIKDAFGSSVAQTGAQTAAEQVGTQAAKQAAVDVGAQAASQVGSSASSGAFGVQTLSDGSTLMSDGSVIPAGAESSIGSTLGTAAGIAGVVKGTYDVAKGWDRGGKGVRSGMTTAGASAGGMIGGPVGAAVGAAYGNAIGYGFQGSGWKNDLVLGLVSPGLLAAKKMGLKPHVSTRQEAISNTQKLMDIAPDDATFQQYVAGAREAYNAAPVDPSKPFAGKYASWDEYEKAGLEAPDLTHVFGNIETYGPDWARLTEQQRIAVTQENINRGNYFSKKGDVHIRDKKAALEAWNAALNPSAQPTTAPATPQEPQQQRGGGTGPLVMGVKLPGSNRIVNVTR